ncbi:conserved domain protein [Nitratidesulfovibrio vulgaris str. Hildenborough]|uniref:Conserved domain protein n=1 Tax=Nitratidesulfovibrio vulgaris (strain ATCC 29579 / DSM 644 / CCUG 34227 / NCIMB 8303 / VKM B-1760 / Hildenborough) TaxID=882 RepID=Q72EK4_NITV2|nr:conserved domain protein [Nitratidesulfovibrio vulgaris str. Hildenborough]
MHRGRQARHTVQGAATLPTDEKPPFRGAYNRSTAQVRLLPNPPYWVFPPEGIPGRIPGGIMPSGSVIPSGSCMAPGDIPSGDMPCGIMPGGICPTLPLTTR